MIVKKRAVRVQQVPERVTAVEERIFLQDLQKHVEIERPRFVLDCSKVGHMDNAAIHLLLSCLEEVMKRNGDVRLALLRPAAEAALRLAGVDRLFEMYATVEGAVHSFYQGSAGSAQPAFGSEGFENDSEFAA